MRKQRVVCLIHSDLKLNVLGEISLMHLELRYEFAASMINVEQHKTSPE